MKTILIGKSWHDNNYIITVNNVIDENNAGDAFDGKNFYYSNVWDCLKAIENFIHLGYAITGDALKEIYENNKEFFRNIAIGGKNE